MGNKIKKFEKPKHRYLPELKIRYNFVVPLVGIVDILTMASFYVNPATDGSLILKSFYLVCAMIGVGFTYWGFMWKITADNSKVRIRPPFGASREVAYGDIRRVEIHKKKRNKALVHFTLFGKSGEELVRVYPLMKNSGDFLERLKILEIKITEVEDK